jgi:hypothetical protein
MEKLVKLDMRLDENGFEIVGSTIYDVKNRSEKSLTCTREGTAGNAVIGIDKINAVFGIKEFGHFGSITASTYASTEEEAKTIIKDGIFAYLNQIKANINKLLP